MAILRGKALKGALGNVSFSQQGELCVVRSKPGKGKMKQSKATKRTAAVFGTVASPLARLFRQLFTPLHQGDYDGGMVNRMNAEVATLVHQHVDENGRFHFREDSFQRLAGFDFNQHSALNKSLLVSPMLVPVADGLELRLPALNLKKDVKFPAKAVACKVQWQVVQFNPGSGQYRTMEPEPLILKKGEDSSASQLYNFHLPEGVLTLAGLALEYRTAFGVKLNDRKFNPAGIVAAVYLPGKPADVELEGWHASGLNMK